MTNEKKVLFFEKNKEFSGKINGIIIIPNIKGKWNLLDYNKLSVQQENHLTKYEIEYLSKTFIKMKLIAD